MTVQLLRRRFTVDEYQRMGQVGILGEDDRLELLEASVDLDPLIGGTDLLGLFFGHTLHRLR